MKDEARMQDLDAIAQLLDAALARADGAGETLLAAHLATAQDCVEDRRSRMRARPDLPA